MNIHWRRVGCQRWPLNEIARRMNRTSIIVHVWSNRRQREARPLIAQLMRSL